MGGTRWGVIATVAAIAMGTAACGSDQRSTRVTRVAIATPGRLNDLDWTRQARDAFEAIAERPKMSGSVADGASVADVGSVLERLSQGGTQLVIAHEPRYATAAAGVAVRTKVPELVWGDRPALRPGLVGDVEVASAEGGYLAGALAAHATDKKSVAVLIAADGTGWDAVNWNRMAGGFIAGARSIVPNVAIAVEWVGGASGVEAAEMKQAAERVFAHGAQTVFALGGASAIGVLRAVDRTTGEQEYAGVIGDKMTVNTESDVVTSVLYDFGALFRRAIADVRAGTFGRRPYTLSFENRGLRLLQTGRTPQDAYNAAMAAKARIARGQVQVPQTSTPADVRALLREGPHS